jgi:hypothetical protein
MMSVVSELRLFSTTSSPRRVSLAPGPDSSLTSTECWRNVRSFSGYRRLTWRCERRYWRRSRNAACIPPMGGTCRWN